MEMWKYSTVVLLLAFGHSIAEADKVKVSVYYEALCSDSKIFITKQLFPNYRDLKENIDLDLVPYGKATTNRDNNGDYVFDCQHGPKECLGNKIQACVLHKEGLSLDEKMQFIACVMNTRNPVDSGLLCANQQKLDYESVKSCANSAQGSSYLAEYGVQTWAVKPKITFVPTIVFNGQFDYRLQDDSLYDFKTTVCGLIQGTKPQACVEQ